MTTCFSTQREALIKTVAEPEMDSGKLLKQIQNGNRIKRFQKTLKYLCLFNASQSDFDVGHNGTEESTNLTYLFIGKKTFEKTFFFLRRHHVFLIIYLHFETLTFAIK